VPRTSGVEKRLLMIVQPSRNRSLWISAVADSCNKASVMCGGEYFRGMECGRRATHAIPNGKANLGKKIPVLRNTRQGVCREHFVLSKKRYEMAPVGIPALEQDERAGIVDIVANPAIARPRSWWPASPRHPRHEARQDSDRVAEATRGGAVPHSVALHPTVHRRRASNAARAPSTSLP
jgi:hypothetical protein